MQRILKMKNDILFELNYNETRYRIKQVSENDTIVEHLANIEDYSWIATNDAEALEIYSLAMIRYSELTKGFISGFVELIRAK